MLACLPTLPASAQADVPGPLWAHFTPDNSGLADLRVVDIIEAPDGAMWFIHPDALSRFDGQAWQTYPTGVAIPEDHSIPPGDLPDRLPSPSIDCAAEDSRGALWLGTRVGVFRLAPTPWEHHIPAYRGMANYQVRDVLRDSYGIMWFAAYDPVSGEGSLSGLDPEGRWLFFNAEVEGLVSNQIVALAEDVDGGLWAGSVHSGVSRYLGNAWQSWTSADSRLPDDRIIDIRALDGGRVMAVVTAGGVARYDVDADTWELWDDAPDSVTAAKIVDPDGMLWRCEADGLVRYDPDGARSVTFDTATGGLVEGCARLMYIEDDGTLVFGTDRVYVSVYRPDPPAHPVITRDMLRPTDTVTFNIATEAWWPSGALVYHTRLDDRAWRQHHAGGATRHRLSITPETEGLEAGAHVFCVYVSNPLLDASPETCARFIIP